MAADNVKIVHDEDLSPGAPFVVCNEVMDQTTTEEGEQVLVPRLVPYLAYATQAEADKVAADLIAGGPGVH